MKPLKKIQESEQEDLTNEIKEEPKQRYAKVTEVVATTSNAFELENGELVDVNELLLRIYNKLLKIERSVA
jgi:hypothetical protein